MGAKLRICQKCGREYTRSAENGGGFKYCCLDCAYAARKDKYNAFYAPEREAAAERRREREEQRAAGTYITRPYERHKAKQTDNDAEIKRINAEAQAAGMSYGRFVSMLAIKAEQAEKAKQFAKCPRTVNGIVVPERLLNAQIERRRKHDISL